jgi:hypothetical protein
MGNLYDWASIYPANQDGYKLFERLDAGDPVEITVKGVRYRMQFKGERFGGCNYLVVSVEGQTQRKYGWGWESGVVFQALEEIQKGWEIPQRYKYRPMQGVTNTETV